MTSANRGAILGRLVGCSERKCGGLNRAALGGRRVRDSQLLKEDFGLRWGHWSKSAVQYRNYGIGKQKGRLLSGLKADSSSGDNRNLHTNAGLKDNNISVLANVLDNRPDLINELLSALSKETRSRLANTILDGEMKSGQMHYEVLKPKHRRKIMMRELSISMGREFGDTVGESDTDKINEDDLTAIIESLKTTPRKETLEVPLEPTRKELFQLGLLVGVPFIGFGFVDNAIMLISGDVFDLTLGRMLGISTLAAAGLGNLVSDVAGLGLGGYIEAYAAKLGLKDPGLTMAQMKSRTVRLLQLLATSIGISIGCLLGMVPLLWMSPEDNSRKVFNIIEERQKERNGFIDLADFRSTIESASLIIGKENVNNVCKRLEEEFAPNSKLSHEDIRNFMRNLSDEKVLEAIEADHHFALLFLEVAG